MSIRELKCLEERGGLMPNPIRVAEKKKKNILEVQWAKFHEAGCACRRTQFYFS